AKLTPLTTLKGKDGEIKGLAFTPEGTHLVAGNDRGGAVWGVQQSKHTTTLRGQIPFLEGFALSPDGQTAASTSNNLGVTMLWKLDRRPQRAVLTEHTSIVTSVALSPDGLILASGSWDRTVMLWDTAQARRVTTLQGHTKPVRHVA